MTTSIKHSQSGNSVSVQTDALFAALADVQRDVEALRALLATHIHSGVTVGAGNTGVPTVTIAAAALNVQP